MNTSHLASGAEAVTASNGFEHNHADDSFLTRGPARVWNALAEPLADHIYTPLEEWNHYVGVAAVAATLTLPRLAEIPLSQGYVEDVRSGNRLSARLKWGAKLLLKATDGLDGAAARQSNTASLFGAGADPAVDMAGSLSDTWAIKQLAKDEGDTAVGHLMNVSNAIDAAAIVTGGFGNTLAAKYAEKNGVTLPADQQVGATAMGKAKYAAKGTGNSLLELRQTIQNPTARKVLRAAGIGFNALSVGMGVISIGQYTKGTISKIQMVRKQTKNR